MAGARATVHGAVSLVNAIATQKGATVGIALKVEATVRTAPGKGAVVIQSDKPTSSRLVRGTVAKIVSKRNRDQNRITVSLDSEIPAGYGLKSSSAISSAVALACARIFKPGLTDRQILLAGVNASIESKVSITGAYDDACSCYYGGFNVTDNAKRKRIAFEDGPSDMTAVIHVPRKRKRGNIRNLRNLSSVFGHAWELARDARYWDAMTINGLATAAVLGGRDSGIIADLVGRGAVGASISGNGPAIAAVVQKGNESGIKRVFAALDGTTILSDISNTKAHVHEV